MIVPKPELHADILSQRAQYRTDEKDEYIPLPVPEDHGRDHKGGVHDSDGSHDEESSDEIVNHYQSTECPKKDFHREHFSVSPYPPSNRMDA